MKTIYAFSALNPVASLIPAYRRISYLGSAPTANAIIISSEGFRSATERYLNVSALERTLIGEAVSWYSVTEPYHKLSRRCRSR